jgi:hypothetical protein
MGYGKRVTIASCRGFNSMLVLPVQIPAVRVARGILGYEILISTLRQYKLLVPNFAYPSSVHGDGDGGSTAPGDLDRSCLPIRVLVLHHHRVSSRPLVRHQRASR